jgi:hypothetical protein
LDKGEEMSYTEQEFNEAMARLDGYTNIRKSVRASSKNLYADHPEYGRTQVPDYLGDLNYLMPLAIKHGVLQKVTAHPLKGFTKAIRDCLWETANAKNSA